MSIPSEAQPESMKPKLQVEKPHQSDYASICVTRVHLPRKLSQLKKVPKRLSLFTPRFRRCWKHDAVPLGRARWHRDLDCVQLLRQRAHTYWRYWTVLVRIIGVDRDQCDTRPTRAVTGRLLVKGATAENTDAATQISYRHFFYTFLVLEGFSTENRECKTLMMSQCVKLN